MSVRSANHHDVAVNSGASKLNNRTAHSCYVVLDNALHDYIATEDDNSLFRSTVNLYRVADGMDCGSPIWNSEGIQGDAEVWEMTGPNVYLGRAFTPNHQAFGRFRGGAAWESLWMVRGSRLVNVTLTGSGCHNGGVFHKGLFGGYPSPGWKCLWARGTNLRKLIERGGKVLMDGKDLFDPAQPYWGGKKPEIRYPE